MTKHKNVDRYLLIGSRHEKLSQPNWFAIASQWQEQNRSVLACPGYYSETHCCLRLRCELYQAHKPLRIEMAGTGKGTVGTLNGPVLESVHKDAVAVLAPYLKDVIWDPIYSQSPSGPVLSNYYARLVPPHAVVDFGRGRVKIQPRMCAECGFVETVTPNCREMGILRWQSQGRPVVADGYCSLAVLPEFFHDMKLNKRFPDLKITHKIKIYDEDPCGWVLPGDPEWDGTLRTPANWKDLPTEQTPKQKAEWDAAIARVAKLLVTEPDEDPQ